MSSNLIHLASGKLLLPRYHSHKGHHHHRRRLVAWRGKSLMEGLTHSVQAWNIWLVHPGSFLLPHRTDFTPSIISWFHKDMPWLKYLDVHSHCKKIHKFLFETLFDFCVLSQKNYDLATYPPKGSRLCQWFNAWELWLEGRWHIWLK